MKALFVTLYSWGRCATMKLNFDGERTMQAVLAPPPIPIGRIKSFGSFGPKYEVGAPLRQLGDGDWMIEITMVETGEKTEYRRSRLIDDPDAV